MHSIDWIIMLIPLLIIFNIGWYSRRYIKSVAHFMSGGRVAGRYVLAVAQGELQSSVMVFVAFFELVSNTGFTTYWWSTISTFSLLIVAIFGFVFYRYRETRAMTLAQFFEIRYSKKFRLFTGALGFFAGILNFGIAPVLGAKFFVYFLGLPTTLSIHSASVPTYIPLMALFIAITVTLTLTGGVITVMVTNCVEGILTQMFYLVIIFALLAMFSWSDITEVIANRPSGQSLLNPFDCANSRDFNFAYYLMLIFVNVYGTMAWQGGSGYNSGALNPHEARMGSILARWREMGRNAMIPLMGVCALTFLSHPHMSSLAAPALKAISHIADPQTQQQMRIPIAASYLLPMGVKGMFCIIMIMGMFGGDSANMHSWSSIFIQDVLLPFRKKLLTPSQHIMLLRLSVVGVGLFAFFFGILFRQTEYIIMWWQVTGAIYIGGAGAAIIGGLYWKKGTTAGAWVALITGSTLATGGIILRQLYGSQVPLNGIQIFCVAAATAITLYVVVSLLTCKEDFNMDRMLHRGKYATALPAAEEDAKKIPVVRGIGKLLGFDKEFTRTDKWVAGSLFGWMVFWCSFSIIGSVWNCVSPWPISVWATYWHIVGVGIPIFMATVTGIWFTWGGLSDIRGLFRRLKGTKVNPLDDGRVMGHQNLDETSTAESVAPPAIR